MSAPTGPMDPERLVDLRQGLEWNKNGRSEFRESDPKVSPALVEELLAAHDHHALMVDRLVRQEYGAVSVACDATGVSADAVRATAASRAADTLRRDPLALAAVDREAEIKRLQAEVTRLEARRVALEAEVEGLRNVARGLAQAVARSWPQAARKLAEDVLEADARGAL